MTSTHPYRRLIPHLFGIFRLQELVGAFFAVPLPRAETGTGADGLVIGYFRTGESVASRRPLVVVADPVGGVYVELVVSCNQEPAAFRLGLAQAQCNVFIMVYYSVRPTWAKACARAYAISLPGGL